MASPDVQARIRKEGGQLISTSEEYAADIIARPTKPGDLIGELDLKVE